jgi:hypothetical protein
MQSFQKYLNLLLVIAIIILLFLNFRKATVINNQTIQPLKTEVQQKKVIVEHLATKTTNYKTHLETFKTHYDTANIVPYQDSVIMTQDTQIVVLNQIVNKQDTIINLNEKEIKQVKRQRNWLIVLSGILATGLMIK